ncbi:hypothetical protein [Rothia nasimurium]|uniref:hypothetical protein n=1 Tax=Rothia nasimurium TaxID=85336 RepID=UPI001F48D414|nr:hypothetical protein [Rothia nasimurium]
MTRIYKVEVHCPICDWYAGDWAPNQLGLIPVEEALEELAAEHVKTVHPLDFEKKGQANG